MKFKTQQMPPARREPKVANGFDLGDQLVLAECGTLPLQEWDRKHLQLRRFSKLCSAQVQHNCYGGEFSHAAGRRGKMLIFNVSV